MMICTNCGSANPLDCMACLRCQHPLPREIEQPQFASSMMGVVMAEADAALAQDDGRFSHDFAEPDFDPHQELQAFDQRTSAMTLQEANFTPAAAMPGLAEVLPELKPWLVVVRGEKLHVSYPILPGANVIGRMSDQPVDIDVDGQEPQERVWTSRRHAMIHATADAVFVEDLASLNGTFVNRAKLPPGAKRALQEGDIIQMGTIQLAVKFSADRP
jgi:hypothetical protein